MKIEEVEALAESAKDNWHLQEPEGLFLQAIETLRAEAWYPIERAEEMGVKDGGSVILFHPSGVWIESTWDKSSGLWLDYDGDDIECEPTHFKRIITPEVK